MECFFAYRTGTVEIILGIKVCKYLMELLQYLLISHISSRDCGLFAAAFAVIRIIVNIIIHAAAAYFFKILSFISHFGGHYSRRNSNYRVTGKHQKDGEKFIQRGSR